MKQFFKNSIGILMLIVGISMQIITYFITKDSTLALISGITGVVSVVCCSERKLSFYLWSFIQLSTYAIICYHSGLYGKLIENLFYFITMLIGIYIWKRNICCDNIIEVRSLNKKQLIKLLIITVLLITAGTFILNYIGGQHTLLDSSTAILGIIAQILMISRFKENWILWFIQDIICIILWISVGNWCLVSQYIFWTLNTVYGYILWSNDENT